MQPESRKHLEDVRRAAELLGSFVDGKSSADYLADPLLRSAVERQFQIIGEALNRLAKVDSTTIALVAGAPRIIAFRNILVHGYDSIDHRIVWDVVQINLSDLKNSVISLMASP